MCITYTPSKYVPDFSLAGGWARRERPERWKCVNKLGLGWARRGQGSASRELGTTVRPEQGARYLAPVADTLPAQLTPPPPSTSIQWPEYTHPASHEPSCRGKSPRSPSSTRSASIYAVPNSADHRSAWFLVRSVSQCPNKFDLDILRNQKLLVLYLKKSRVYNMKCNVNDAMPVPISSNSIKVYASDRWKLHKNRRVLPQIFGHSDFLSFFFISTKIPTSTHDRSLKILLF